MGGWVGWWKEEERGRLGEGVQQGELRQRKY